MKKYKPIDYTSEEMPGIIIWTVAYNAHRTLVRTIESVLKQTFTDFVWYILDNGSDTLETYDIICSYVKKDKRIVPMRIKKNSSSDWFVLQLFKKYENTEAYFAFIDADDEWHENMLEGLLPFAKKNNLDIAACGVNYIDEMNDNIFRIKKTDENIIIDNSLFADKFGIYRTFFIQKWAKLYKIKMLAKCDFVFKPKIKNNDSPLILKVFELTKNIIIRNILIKKYWLKKLLLGYWLLPIRSKIIYSISKGLLENGFNVAFFSSSLSDIPFNMQSLKNSVRIGVLDKIFYSYYNFPQSESNNFKKFFTFRKVNSDIYPMEEYLNSFGEISEYNKQYLIRIYYSCFEKILPAFKKYDLTNDDMDYEDKLEEIFSLFSKKPMYNFLQADNDIISNEKKIIFLNEFLYCIFSDKKYREKKYREYIEGILILMDAKKFNVQVPDEFK